MSLMVARVSESFAFLSLAFTTFRVRLGSLDFGEEASDIETKKEDEGSRVTGLCDCVS